MSKRLTRKEIKHDIREDEVRHFLVRLFEQIRLHPSAVTAGIVTILSLIILSSLVFAFLDNRRGVASQRLAKAMKIVNAPIDESAPRPDDPKAPSYANVEDRNTSAKLAFEEISGSVGSSSAGNVADLYLADLAIASGDTSKAREIWEDFLSADRRDILSVSVRLNLIRLDRSEGHSEAVAEQLEKELGNPDKQLPEDLLLFELATTFEELGRHQEATDLFQQILDEYPRSAYSARARRSTTTS